MAGKGLQIDAGGGLTAYLAAADATTAELLASDSPLVATIHQYDDYIRTRLWAGMEPEPIALILFMNAYQVWMAGIRAALSGHSVAVFPTLRTALESAAFGGLIVENPELSEVWSHRHRDEASHKACRKAFTFDRAIAPLEAKAPSLHWLAVQAYSNAIDYGAHPNIKGVFGHVTMDEDRSDNHVAVVHTSLYGAGHVETIRGLCACLDFGLAIIGTIAATLSLPSGQISQDLQALSDAKDDATAPYSVPSPTE